MMNFYASTNRYLNIASILGGIALLLFTPTILFAQIGGFPGGGNPGGGFPGGGNPGGGFPGGGGGAGGITIDAQGVVSTFSRKESVSLMKRRIKEIVAKKFDDEFAAPSELRKVSLKEIERIAVQAQKAGEPIPEEVRYLFGLIRIDYVFIDPDKGDVILAGPAEAFVTDAAGRVRGATSGRPPILLDDLLVAFRSTFLGRETIGVSIDPVPERTAALQQYIRSNSNAVSRARAARRYQEMAKVLGMQTVSLFGVPKESHFAQILTEADYRMKRIAIGKEPSGVRKIRSQLTMLKPSGNAMQRWWFTPLYNPIEVGEESLAFRLSGPRCQLMAQEEWTDIAGNRSDAPFTRATTQNFAKQFTEHFDELTHVSPVFAELQNCFDLTVVAALLRQQNVREQIHWKMESLLDEKMLPIQSYPVPKSVPSVAMSRPAGRSLLGMIGGVTMNPFPVVQKKFNRKEAAQLKKRRVTSLSRRSKTHPGWWK